MTTEPIINQPWEDVSADVCGAIQAAVQPLLKKAVDDIYGGLLDTTQDYLTENLAFNIASRIDTAEREARRDRELCVALVEALEKIAGMTDVECDFDAFDARKEAIAALTLAKGGRV